MALEGSTSRPHATRSTATTKKMDTLTITTQKTPPPLTVETVLVEDMGDWLTARGMQIVKGWWRGNQCHVIVAPIISADIPAPAESRP